MKFSSVQLEAFIALEETLRFAAAADRCHVSPSAFSQIISRLEQEVGVKLFDRDTRNVYLTSEGEVFARGVRRILAEVNISMSELRDRIAGSSGQVSIASTPSVCTVLLPNLMAQFREKYPHITLNLHDSISERCLDLLRQGYVDFSIVGLVGDSFEFESIPLFDEPFYLLCQSSDPLAKHASLTLKQLKGRDYVHIAGSGSIWAKRKNDLREAGICEIGIEVSNFSTLVGLVSVGFGVTLVPRIALPLCQRTGLVARPITDKSFVRTFFLVTRRGRSLSVAAGNMTALLMEATKAGSVALEQVSGLGELL